MSQRQVKAKKESNCKIDDRSSHVDLGFSD